MKDIALYPLRFQPIYEYRLWGGRRLGQLLSAALPGDGPIGEAWMLSDRDEHASVVATGALAGMRLRQLLQQSPERLLGSLSGSFERFPLLLKFLDVSDRLSVQVHPADAPSAKDEAWVVIEQGREARIYAGLQPGVSETVMRQAIDHGSVPQQLASFAPKSGDSVFIAAGTVHALRDIVVFEVQQNSDVTFRVYDWNHVDPRTGKARPLQVEQAMACIDFRQGAVGPGTPVTQQTRPVLRELLVDSDHFDVTRITGPTPSSSPRTVAARTASCWHCCACRPATAGPMCCCCPPSLALAAAARTQSPAYWRLRCRTRGESHEDAGRI